MNAPQRELAMGRLVLHWACVCAVGAAPLVGCTEVFNPITEIIDSSGDGDGNILDNTLGASVDGSGNVYVSGRASDNVFKIAPNGTITQIIDANGDGEGNLLEEPFGVPVDASGNVYVGGGTSDNVFKIEPNGTITEIIDATGDGVHPLDGAGGVSVDGSGNVSSAPTAIRHGSAVMGKRAAHTDQVDPGQVRRLLRQPAQRGAFVSRVHVPVVAVPHGPPSDAEALRRQTPALPDPGPPSGLGRATHRFTR